MNMSSLNIRWARIYHSIIFRVVLFGVIGVVLANGTRAYLSLRILKSDTIALVTAQQAAVSKDVATDIARMVVMRKSTLDGMALGLPSVLLDQPEALREWLRGQHRVVAPFFDGLSLERDGGAVIAAFPPDLNVFEGAPGGVAGDVQIGVTQQAPALSMSVVLPTSVRHVNVRLRGVTKLAVPGFLDSLQTHKNGVSGSSLVVFANERLYFDLSDPVPRLQPVREGIALFALSATGMQPPGPLVNPLGQEVLAGLSPVPGLAWAAVAVIPLKEAFLPVENKTRYYLGALPFVLPIFLLFSGLVAYFILRPLGRTARLADKMTRGETPLIRLPVAKPDEIGAMTAAFNRLLDRLDDQAKELGAQKELAEAAAMAKSRFLAAASHDLRQPMHALNLYLGALDRFDLPDAARPAMASARECAQTMDEMFRALLDISKLDASATQANISTFAIAPLLEKIKNGFVQQAHAKGLELRVGRCSAFVSSDPELLERVLANLVSNAVRYTEHGQILMGCRRTPVGLRVGVYDTGPGIAADQQRAVFEEFYQVGNPERDRAQGLGLGLAIVQRVGMLLKAPLSLSSELGKGSVFSIEVPRADPQAAESLEAVYAMRGQHGTLTGALIAVIDDEPLILDATALVLRQWGCTVVTAASGDEAIQRLSVCDRVPDAIVCDHRLRGTETGIDVIAAIRIEFNNDIPAVLVTGDTSPQRIQSMATTGIPVLNKPLQDHVLMDALLRLLNRLPMA
jgi:signal transduction histidine kinase/CheY-like chemotaxis protein